MEDTWRQKINHRPSEAAKFSRRISNVTAINTSAKRELSKNATLLPTLGENQSFNIQSSYNKKEMLYRTNVSEFAGVSLERVKSSCIEFELLEFADWLVSSHGLVILFRLGQVRISSSAVDHEQMLETFFIRTIFD